MEVGQYCTAGCMEVRQYCTAGCMEVGQYCTAGCMEVWQYCTAGCMEVGQYCTAGCMEVRQYCTAGCMEVGSIALLAVWRYGSIVLLAVTLRARTQREFFRVGFSSHLLCQHPFFFRLIHLHIFKWFSSGMTTWFNHVGLFDIFHTQSLCPQYCSHCRLLNGHSYINSTVMNMRSYWYSRVDDDLFKRIQTFLDNSY